MAAHKPQTWHYGIVAQHWAAFENHKEDSPDINYYHRLIERSGQPALDAGCGTGRLLLPFLQRGLDVDGVDISEDMIDLCREKAAMAGHAPNLYSQPLHALQLPRRYRTIFVCNAFGIGSSREQDELALRRFYDLLEPGGALAFDLSTPYGEQFGWQWEFWRRENRAHLDPDWWPEGEFETAPDGRVFRMRSKIAELDPLEQVLTLQYRAELWREEALVGEEEYFLTQNIYFKNEIILLLAQAGFKDITVTGDFTGEPATPDHNALVFYGQKPEN